LSIKSKTCGATNMQKPNKKKLCVNVSKSHQIIWQFCNKSRLVQVENVMWFNCPNKATNIKAYIYSILKKNEKFDKMIKCVHSYALKGVFMFLRVIGPHDIWSIQFKFLSQMVAFPPSCWKGSRNGKEQIYIINNTHLPYVFPPLVLGWPRTTLSLLKHQSKSTCWNSWAHGVFEDPTIWTALNLMRRKAYDLVYLSLKHNIWVIWHDCTLGGSKSFP